jgi:sterol desaturase/sphingolipid hydroxylase (fatty acid hydroxylase superfamily)
MNTNKNISDNKLGELFREIPLDNPSPDFMEKLIVEIEKEVVREKRKQQWLTAGQIAAAISGILILPALAIYLCTIFLPGFSFTFPEINLHFDLNIVVIAFAILMLLIIDTLFRTRKRSREKNEYFVLND